MASCITESWTTDKVVKLQGVGGAVAEWFKALLHGEEEISEKQKIQGSPPGKATFKKM